jgi:hypothetical protein
MAAPSGLSHSGSLGDFTAGISSFIGNPQVFNFMKIFTENQGNCWEQ